LNLILDCKRSTAFFYSRRNSISHASSLRSGNAETPPKKHNVPPHQRSITSSISLPCRASHSTPASPGAARQSILGGTFLRQHNKASYQAIATLLSGGDYCTLSIRCHFTEPEVGSKRIALLTHLDSNLYSYLRKSRVILSKMFHYSYYLLPLISTRADNRVQRIELHLPNGLVPPFAIHPGHHRPQRLSKPSVAPYD
jgi:hypothetical protein